MRVGLLVVACAVAACSDLGPRRFSGEGRRLFTGETTACVLNTAGDVFCWGANTDRWEFGASPSVMPGSLFPTRSAVPTLASFAAGAGTHGCGITPEGRGVCWGRGGWGQLGAGTLGDTGNAPALVRSTQRFRQIWVGRLETCGVTDEGRGMCWGSNQHGEIGVAFVDIEERTTSPIEVDGEFRFKQLIPGWLHTCGLTESGEAYCWGSNDAGQLGDPAIEFLPAQRTPRAVTGGLRFSELALGARHTCGLTTDGVAYCWGENFSGQVGDGTSGTARTAPTRVQTTQRFVHIAASSGFAGASNAVPPIQLPGALAHTCALTVTGAAYCWGWNANGQLGDGTLQNRSVPVAVSGTASFTTIGLGGSYTCGMRDNDVWCWGSNMAGQLGANRSPGSPSPVPVKVLSTFNAPVP